MLWAPSAPMSRAPLSAVPSSKVAVMPLSDVEIEVSRLPNYKVVRAHTHTYIYAHRVQLVINRHLPAHRCSFG